MTLDIAQIRQQFPALMRQDRFVSTPVFLDNPGGTQIAQMSIDRMMEYMINHNANHEGVFKTSRDSDAILAEAHQAAADFINARQPEEIIFGANMTSLTLHMSRSLARTWRKNDEIVVTNLDHDANVNPWILAANDRDCHVHYVNFHKEDGTLNIDEFRIALEGKPRLVAVGYASNALGTINPLAKLIAMAHDAGALVYVDAVQYAPHGPIDVQLLGCDFLVCSAYKYFGPHVGILYGRYNLLNELFAYKVRPATNIPPGKFETGTLNHEGIAGVLGALEYLDWLGSTFGEDYKVKYHGIYSARGLHHKMAMSAIRSYEYELSRRLLESLQETPGVEIHGLKDVRRLEERVPTFSFSLKGWHPRLLAEKLDESMINVWDGNYYALAVTEQLGLEDSGGMVRVGAVHYNTLAEIDRFREVLGKIAFSKSPS